MATVPAAIRRKLRRVLPDVTIIVVCSHVIIEARTPEAFESARRSLRGTTPRELLYGERSSFDFPGAKQGWLYGPPPDPVVSHHERPVFTERKGT